MVRETLKEKIHRIDTLIRAGQAAAARQELRSIQHRRIPRPLAREAAALSRRASLHELAVKILHPIIRPTDKRIDTATDEEKAEYAASLSYIGASEEALQLFQSLNSKAEPSVLLLHAFAHFSQWDYAQAIPLLYRYIDSPKLNDYQRLIGKVNVASALLNEEHFEKAETLLQELCDQTGAHRAKLLHGNVLEMLASCSILQRKYENAENYLTDALKLLEPEGGLYVLFVNKWRGVLSLFRDGVSTQTKVKLDRIRREAKACQHWESLRDCDRYQAIAEKNTKLATHLYLGTPFTAYREKIRRKFPNLEIPIEYEWVLAPGKGAVVDIDTGSVSGKTSHLKEGQFVHRLFLALCSDFYRPFRLATLFSRLYPNEYYNPLSSGPRVFRVLERLRQWLAESKIPLSVLEERGFYQLRAKSPVSILIRRAGSAANRYEALVHKLSQRMGEVPFPATEAKRQLGLSLRTTLRVLDQACREGKAARLGAGPKTLYRLVTGRTMPIPTTKSH